jgi:hypothetical protein
MQIAYFEITTLVGRGACMIALFLSKQRLEELVWKANFSSTN